jgi:hypothetical protein
MRWCESFRSGRDDRNPYILDCFLTYATNLLRKDIGAGDW